MYMIVNAFSLPHYWLYSFDYLFCLKCCWSFSLQFWLIAANLCIHVFVSKCARVCASSSSLKRIVLFHTTKQKVHKLYSTKIRHNYEEPFRTVLRFALRVCACAFFIFSKESSCLLFFSWEAPSFKTGDASRIPSEPEPDRLYSLLFACGNSPS